MPLDAEAICAPAIAEVSTGITLSRDPATCLHEKTRLARGHVLVWEHMMQTSCIPLKRSQDGILLKAGMGDSTCARCICCSNHRPQNP